MAIPLDDQQRQHLGAEVRKRVRELRITQQEAASRSEISPATFDRIINGRAASISERTLDRLDLGLDWQPRQGDEMGSAERAIHGGSALPADHPRAVEHLLVDEQGRPYRHLRVMPEGAELGDQVSERERWIQVWDDLAAWDVTVARMALQMVESLRVNIDDAERPPPDR
jgi:DNA-binding Xre family transcriptional regulator